MIELVVLWKITRSLRKRLVAKRQPLWYALLGPVLWLLFEFIGATIGVILGFDRMSYVLAIIAAVIGAKIAYMIIDYLPRLPYHPATE